MSICFSLKHAPESAPYVAPIQTIHIMASVPVSEIRQVSVLNPRPDPTGKYTIYTVRVQIQPVAIDQDETITEFFTRFRECKKLERCLGQYYRDLFRPEPFPTLPIPEYRTRFDASVIEERRQAIERMLQFINDRPYLHTHASYVFEKPNCLVTGNVSCYAIHFVLFNSLTMVSSSSLIAFFFCLLLGFPPSVHVSQFRSASIRQLHLFLSQREYHRSTWKNSFTVDTVRVHMN
ncbi:unnamed protein product [Echinostoma caproni]|uniref:PX domain-containing protein n=1 Tax=Echinostoma caproni TaxID=27848 RepID=A0A183A1B5_9TREM|nr:unnamed protein product [Echinostoma caproni]